MHVTIKGVPIFFAYSKRTIDIPVLRVNVEKNEKMQRVFTIQVSRNNVTLNKLW